MHNAIFYPGQRFKIFESFEFIPFESFKTVLRRSRWEELKAWGRWQSEHDHHCDEGADEGEGEGETGGVWADKVGAIVIDDLLTFI